MVDLGVPMSGRLLGPLEAVVDPGATHGHGGALIANVLLGEPLLYVSSSASP